MMTKVLGLTPMLETGKLNDTVVFYTEILGFQCNSYDEETGWAHMIKDDAAIMFSTPNGHRNFPGPVMSGSLYMIVENVDAVWKVLKDKCKVCYPIENFDYGMREFAIYDNNGYLLQFGQEIES